MNMTLASFLKFTEGNIGGQSNFLGILSGKKKADGATKRELMPSEGLAGRRRRRRRSERRLSSFSVD